MSEFNGETAAIEQGVFKAFEREGYLKEDATRDMAKVRERIFEVVAQHKVLNKKERGEKAITRGDLVAQVFPNLPGPDAWDEQDNPRLASSVYRKVDQSYVWGEANPSAAKAVQRLVGMNMGNGYVLCRVKIGKDRVPAVYITDDMACIQQDFTRPDNQSLQRKVETLTRNREMLVIRQPKNGKSYFREYDRTLKGVHQLGRDQLKLTLESVTSDDSTDEDDDAQTTAGEE